MTLQNLHNLPLISEQEYTAFAEAAYSARSFNQILERFGPSLKTNALCLAWLARAKFELGQISEARKILAVAVAASPSELPEWAKITLQQCAWADRSEFDEVLPDRLRESVEIFGNFVNRLIQYNEVAPKPDGRFTAATLAIYWVKTGIKVLPRVGQRHIVAADLRDLNLAPDFIDAVAKGPDGPFEACVARSPDLPLTKEPELTPRLFDVAAAVLLRGKPILCPFTGARELVRDSIDMYAYLHRCSGRTCLIIQEDTTAFAAADRAWYFPEERVLIAYSTWHSVLYTLARAHLRTFDNWQAVVEYLSRTDRSILVCDAVVGHLGHYIWNIVSGWSRLFKLVPAEKIDILASHRDFQIFGGVKQLYPDEIGRAGKFVEVANEHDAYKLMLSQGALALTLVDRHVTNDLAKRVIEWCRKNCSSEFLSTVVAARQICSPLLLVTIRQENRAWIEQDSGLPEIINSLAADFPKLGVVIDGLNAGIHSLDTHAFMSLENEMKLTNHIISSCPGVRIYNSVGCSVSEGITWCNAVDAFLAPIGAGMAKYRWITNKPGVAYSNETCLTPKNYDGTLYERHRDNPAPIEYVDRSAVKDVEQERHGMRFRANFSMSWEAAYLKIRDFLIRQPPRR